MELKPIKQIVVNYNFTILIGYTDSDFQSDLDFRKSTLGYVFTLGGGAISWRSVKQSCIADSTMEVEYIATCEAAKEAVWLKKFLSNLGVVRMEQVPITLFAIIVERLHNPKIQGITRIFFPPQLLLSSL